MKNYKEYEKRYIGESDIASLTLRFCYDINGRYCTDTCTKIIRFGSDGEYEAYIVDKNAEIGSHYELVAEGKTWLWIYDDTERTQHLNADIIRVYTAGNYGCIIQLIEEE